MRHHRVVHQHDAEALAVHELDRRRIGELLAIERPCEPFHVPGQVELNRATWLSAIRIVEQTSEVRVRQYAAAVLA